MDARLMTKSDIEEVTGKKRPTAQVQWFIRNFGLHPVQAAGGRIILTWATFEELQAKRAGTTRATVQSARPALVPVRSAA
ncbi:DUF4224 domain-containing protein [Robbsia andropogonis]|uniref:DUF4224 domain-containing protein n=1 Tax=Robbsia andropogonis TaxID=28092 RepID=UPI003D194BA1